MQRYWFLVLFVIFTACAAPTQTADVDVNLGYNDITSPSLADADLLAPGEINRFIFSDWAGPDIPVWAYIPQDVDVRNAPILVMMHGAKRASHRYLKEWRPLAQENGFVVISPEFSTEDFPKAAGYNLGNVFREEGKDALDESVWSFSAIEPIFDSIVAALNSEQSSYTMFGHSAGAQFVHRYLYYKPDARVKRYIAANAGWYTLPEMNEIYPYGLNGAQVSEASVKSALSKDVVILLGDQDNDPDHKSLRRTEEALRQGEHRFARGLYFHKTGQQQASSFGVPYGWATITVEGVAHSNGGMARGATSLIE